MGTLCCLTKPEYHAIPDIMTLCNRFSISIFIIQPPRNKYFACLVHGFILQNSHSNTWGIHSKCPINVCDMNKQFCCLPPVTSATPFLSVQVGRCIALLTLLGGLCQVLIPHPLPPAQAPALPKSAGTYAASSSTYPSPCPAQIFPFLTTVF